MGNKPWTQEEIDYLMDKWGTTTIPYIAKTLGKSLNAIKLKANRIGLGRHIHSGDEITLNQLFKAVGKGNSYTWISKKWISHGIPFRYKKSISKRMKVIDIEEFWEWAGKNKSLLDFSNFERLTLGVEPEWAEEKRRADIKATRFKRTSWTKKEDQYLISLINTYKYSYKDLSEIMNRTVGAIIHRVNDLGIKQRPLRADNHKWSEEEVKLLVEKLSYGYSPDVIADYFPLRSSRAVIGKIERMRASKESLYG